MIKTFAAIAILGLLAAGGAWYLRRESAAAPTLRTGPVTRGDVLAAIGATGTVEPEELIDVGAQVAGQILTFGKDEKGRPIDYGSTIAEGMVLAQIDDSVYAAEVTQAQAQLDSAKAGVKRAEADLDQLRAKLVQAQRDWERAQKLGPSDALAQATYDAYQSTFEQAKANVAIGEAAIVQAHAEVEQAEATLQRARRNLGYTTIKAPVKGVIIDRRVNIGQTVVASLNAPSLFLIAKDLKRMQVWVAVNEADVGSIHPGQPVAFTVDAFPGREFRGEVSKIRLNASMTQNVVTYTVEVTTDNADGTLLPYLTANVQFEVSRKQGVLLVPNAALRWTPETEQVAPDAREAAKALLEPATASATPATPAGAGGQGQRGEGGSSTPATQPVQPQGGMMASASGPTTGPAARAGRSGRGRRGGGAGGRGGELRPGTLWVRDGQYVRPVQVQAGITDGVSTEVQGPDLKEGMEVVVGEVLPETAGAPGGATNPFAPPMIRRGGGGRGGAGGGAGGGGGPPGR